MLFETLEPQGRIRGRHPLGCLFRSGAEQNGGKENECNKKLQSQFSESRKSLLMTYRTAFGECRWRAARAGSETRAQYFSKSK
jgi:hypothetical protein